MGVGADLRSAPARAARGRREWLRIWGPVALWMALIFALSAVPDIPHHHGLPHARNRWLDDSMRTVAHACEYAILSALVWRALARKRAAMVAAAWTVAWALTYAALDELHQRFVPGRTCSLEDWSVDLVGIVLALAVLLVMRAFRKRA